MEKTVIMKKTTIRELAKICGTAPSTVSRALNNSGSVDEDTRQKIVRAAEANTEAKLNTANKCFFIKFSLLIKINYPVQSACNQGINPKSSLNPRYRTTPLLSEL